MDCVWVGSNELMIDYHNNIYGVYKTNRNELLKWLVLEMAQAGLSWQTIINKQIAYDEYFNYFDVDKVAQMDYQMLVKELEFAKIIRNKLKLKAAINAAMIIIEIEQEIQFNDYLRQLIDPNLNLDENIDNAVKVMRKRGFKFIGYEIIKSYFESIGLINNHITSCRYYQKPIFTLASTDK